MATPSSFHKILIANRGEIASRVIRTAHALGYETVAVFSDADADAPYVHLADQAVRLGPAEASSSYLHMERVLAAAVQSVADAIHPGYGFLSENPDFARQVIAAGLTWVGPQPEAMEIMSNKAAAKRLVAATGVPLLPGYAGEAQSDDAFRAAAVAIGYPLMVKAAAGGGGRGMRFVADAEALSAALASARSEALKGFGSAELLLEKAIIKPRHIEFQIFGDQQGHIIHLGERDCSIQRRYQKIVEEAPSPALSADLRQKMGSAAVAVAQAVNYVGAGTVEFLLSESGEFYFMEMNTRLQVEHPVTEVVTGLDLVAWQLLVAQGQPLPLTQAGVTCQGHALEVRLYAESAVNNFLPSTGKVWLWQPPAGRGVRVDDCLASRQVVTPFYDAMVAKIITYGESRDVAQRRMRRALAQTAVLGVETNRAFLCQAITHPIFTAGEATTDFINQIEPAAATPPWPRMAALAAVILYCCQAQAVTHTPLYGWGSRDVAYCFDAALPQALVKVRQNGDSLRVITGDDTFTIQILSCHEPVLHYELDGLRDKAYFAFGDDGRLWLQAGMEAGDFVDVLLAEQETAGSIGNGRITAPMPGAIMRLDVAEGDSVQKGQSLLVLEAMKMEHVITAPFTGFVAQVLVKQGQQMQSREVMIILAATGNEL